MADAQRTIDLIFNGVDKTGAAIQSVVGGTKSFTSGVQSATAPIADFTASAVKFEAALLAAGVAFAAFAINEAASFESALADLNKVLSETDSLENYANLARELGKEYGVAIDEVVRSIASYKQAGFTAEEAGILTRSGLDLVIAGGVEASRAADQVVASLKGFGAEAATVVPFVDLLNQVSNEYAVSVDQLLEGFSTFSPIARSAGLSLQETVGVLVPGIEVFRSGSEVANALRTSFLRLQDDSKPVQDALASIGVAQRDANGELRSARDIYFEVAEALGGVDDNQKAYVASQLVGIQRSSQFLATIEGLDKTLRIAGDGFDFVGSAAKEVALQLATADIAAARVSVAFKDLLINIGTPLLDEFGSVANGISSIFAALSSNLDQGGLAEVTALIESSLASLGEALQAVARNLPAALAQADFSGFTGGLRAIGDSFNFLLGNVNLGSVEGLTRAIELLGAGFEGLSLFTGGVIESFKPLFNFLADLSSNVTGASDIFKDFGNIGGLATQVNIAAGSVSAAIPVFEGLLAVIAVSQAGGLIGSIKTLSSVLGGSGLIALLSGPAGLAATSLAAGAGIGMLANELSEKAGFDSFSTNIGDLVARITGLKAEADKLTETVFIPPSFGDLAVDSSSIVQSLNEVVRSITGVGSAAKDSSLNTFTLALDKAGESAEQSSEWVYEFAATLQDYPEDIRPASDALEKLGADGQRLDGTFSVISSGASAAKDSITSLTGASDELRAAAITAAIEGAASVNVARIQADASTVVSAFESISNTVNSTGESITSLFGLLGSADISKFDKLDIRDQIRDEAEAREKALLRENKLIDAQIRKLNAQTDALRGGNALIKISGDGLRPHLEAFMFEILESIQLTVNAQGQELLLGLEP